MTARRPLRQRCLLAATVISCAASVLSCGPDPDQGLTGLRVKVSFAAELTVMQHRFVLLDNFSIVTRALVFPQPPRALSPAAESLELIVDDHLVDHDISLRVDGLQGEDILGSVRAPVELIRGAWVELELRLGAPAVCGDGELTAPIEECEDSNQDDGDGCTAYCMDEQV